MLIRFVTNIYLATVLVAFLGFMQGEIALSLIISADSNWRGIVAVKSSACCGFYGQYQCVGWGAVEKAGPIFISK
jgi:hypothetical protein